MPYQGASDGAFERARRVGHVPTAASPIVQEALTRWEVPAVDPHPSAVLDQCVALEDLPSPSRPDTRFVIAFDGSPQEVAARSEYPSVRVGYLQVAGVFVDLAKFFNSSRGAFVDPRLLARASTTNIVNAVLPGSNVTAPGLTATENWRAELQRLLVRQGVDDFGSTPFTLRDMLFHLHGSPAQPAATVPVARCPYRRVDECPGEDIEVPPEGISCPSCGRTVWPSDALRSHEEFDDDGSNVTPLTRVMNVVERLVCFAYLNQFAHHRSDLLPTGAFITDGPLAFYGTSAPLKRRAVEYWTRLVSTLEAADQPAPLLLGLEKSGAFVDHAHAISDWIPPETVVSLDETYIRERIKRRQSLTAYGSDEFYGRRFFYKASDGRMLVVTVPRIPGGQPYGEASSEDLAQYPTLRPSLELLDRIGTRLYDNAVMPIALAHSAAALPLGTGTDVLRILAQDTLGIPRQR